MPSPAPKEADMKLDSLPRIVLTLAFVLAAFPVLAADFPAPNKT